MENSNLTTTDIFNIFHDGYKDKIEPHWMIKFREISGATKEQIDNCYWRNVEIPNNEKANHDLLTFLETLG